MAANQQSTRICYGDKDIEVEIFIYNVDRKNVPIVLSVVCESNGILKYKIKQPGPVSIKTIHRETYEESIKILKTQGRY